MSSPVSLAPFKSLYVNRAVCILFTFFVTGWPVSPHLTNAPGNQYESKSLAYYFVLYIHHLLGALLFPFLVFGLFRNLIWKGDKGGNRQLSFLLAYSMLVAAAIAVYLTHRYSPVDKRTEDGEEAAAEPSSAASSAMSLLSANLIDWPSMSVHQH